MNKVILMGRLTRDPEVRQAANESGTTIARYSLAVDRRRTAREGEPTADFINCVVFGHGAEFAEKYLRKGTKIAITGRIQTGSYVNQQGQRVYTTDIVVDEQEFAESRRAAEENAAAAEAAPAQPAAAPQNPAPTGAMPAPEIGAGFADDDEIPFN